jgi:protein-S-isoprenylcysteine O-methyltransferase Ste14
MIQATHIASIAAYASWIVILVVWLNGMRGRKLTAYRSKGAYQLIASVLIFLSFVILLSQVRSGILKFAVTSRTPLMVSLGASLAVVGALFAVWARVTLGSNWSGGAATIKRDHELMSAGPYKLVRHPIYTGFIATEIGTALTMGTLASYVAVLLGIIGFLMRIRSEEQLMMTQFQDAYSAYKVRTKTLVPFLW